ncbi:MAG: hypothetical protein C5B57_00210 [Blastocatellia bacterium]|nr:MAG: hypothetical protein C5B57_00210 [Blastocatellia bacterium]
MTTFTCLPVALLVAIPPIAAAQQRGAPAGPPPTARAAAPIDLTGYWVSVVTEDWRWRMVTPQKGDYASVPLNAEGRRVASQWDPEAEKAFSQECRAFGAAALLRLPTRLHITWQDDTTLKLDTDAGTQTRVLRFGPAPTSTSERTRQGYSAAEWFKQPQSAGLGFGSRGGGLAGGNLKVVTTNLASGYLRKNGVPYSEDTVLTEYFNRHDEPNGDQWITTTRIVEDPKYLQMPFITSESFKKERDGSKWHPTGCEVDPPRQ